MLELFGKAVLLKLFFLKTEPLDAFLDAFEGTRFVAANLEICTLDGCAPCFAAIRAKDGWHA